MCYRVSVGTVAVAAVVGWHWLRRRLRRRLDCSSRTPSLPVRVSDRRRRGDGFRLLSRTPGHGGQPHPFSTPTRRALLLPPSTLRGPRWPSGRAANSTPAAPAGRVSDSDRGRRYSSARSSERFGWAQPVLLPTPVGSRCPYCTPSTGPSPPARAVGAIASAGSSSRRHGQRCFTPSISRVKQPTSPPLLPPRPATVSIVLPPALPC